MKVRCFLVALQIWQSSNNSPGFFWNCIQDQKKIRCGPILWEQYPSAIILRLSLICWQLCDCFGNFTIRIQNRQNGQFWQIDRFWQIDWFQEISQFWVYYVLPLRQITQNWQIDWFQEISWFWQIGQNGRFQKRQIEPANPFSVALYKCLNPLVGGSYHSQLAQIMSILNVVLY